MAGTATVVASLNDRLGSAEYSSSGRRMSTLSIDASLEDRTDNRVCLVDSDMVALRDTDRLDIG